MCRGSWSVVCEWRIDKERRIDPETTSEEDKGGEETGKQTSSVLTMYVDDDAATPWYRVVLAADYPTPAGRRGWGYSDEHLRIFMHMYVCM